MTGGQEDSTISFVLANDIGGRRCGKNGVFSNNKLGDAVCRTDLENSLDCLWRKVSAIATNDKSRVFGLDRVKDCLDKVFRVVLEALLGKIQQQMNSDVTSC